MEVNGGRFIAELVVDYDSDAFTNVAFNDRQWELAIDADHGTCEAIWSCVDPGDVKVVLFICQGY
jgi:hypothetical protein